MVMKAAREGGAQVVVLPECFNSPYGTSYFERYSEQVANGETCRALTALAKEADIVLVGGSFPEKDETGKLYNTCLVIDSQGIIIGKHQKIHLFDVDIEGSIKFKESDALSAGNSLTMVETVHGRFGIGICYDIRFPELATIASRKGCVAMIYPGAFNMTTGPLHWELLQRARALDNQMFIAACSPARDVGATYHAWGHSTVVDPNGKVISTTDEKESIVYADLDPALLHTVRESIPLSKQRRFDLYKDVSA